MKMAAKQNHTRSPILPGFGAGSQMPAGYYSGDKPNPNVVHFVEEHATTFDTSTDDHCTEGLGKAIDTTKATSLFNLHSYFSKKPHDAIRQYICHYTSPGDLVLDPSAVREARFSPR